MSIRVTQSVLGALSLACTAALVITGCSSSSGGTQASTSPGAMQTTAQSGSTQSLNAQLPTDIRDAGTITVATYPGHPPNNFLAPNGKDVIGVDASIRSALAKELGVKFEIDQISSFAGLIPALQSGRVDIIMSGMTDTKEREQQVTFVDYLDVGSSILTQEGNPEHISSIASLCGQKVATVAGTTAIAELTAQDAKCTAAGKPKVVMTQFPGTDQAVLAVKAGRAAASISDFPVTSYYAQKSDGALQVVGQPFNVSPYGIATNPDAKQLQSVLQKAIQQAIQDGSLAAAAKEWGVNSAVPTTATINGATH